MEQDLFAGGTVRIGDMDMSFEKRVIHGQFSIYLPSSFVQDTNLVSKYFYFFSQDRSPLSIAIRFTPGYLEDRERMLSHYFSQGEEGELQRIPPSILYRETITSGSRLSIYSMRFAVEEPEGILFGCFNASAQDAPDWKPVVLQVLQHIEHS